MGERDGLFRRRQVGGRRPHRTIIRHTDAEFVRVQAMAVVEGVSVPRLYERALLAGDVVAAEKLTTIHGDLIVIGRLLANAANNVNQAAKVANTTGEVHAGQLLAAVDLLDGQADRVHQVLADLPGGELFKQVPDRYREDTAGVDGDQGGDAGFDVPEH